MDYDLKTDLDRLLKESLDPINKKMIEQENERHKQFLERHFEKHEVLAERHNSYISQLVTLEGVIFGSVIIFTNSQQITVWLVLALCLILLSLIFGVWRQHLFIQANYQSHEWDYYQELKNHWWTRELWKDEIVKKERELIEPNLEDGQTVYKKRFMYKLLKVFRFNADKIENVYVISFILSLFLLILHLLFKAPVLLKPNL